MMRFKVVLGIIAVVGVVAGVMYFFTPKRQIEEGESEKKEDKADSAHDLAEYKNVSKEAYEDLSETRSDAAEKIKERHEEAKSVIRKSIDNIFGDETAERETKNEDAKNKMFEDLDNI